MMTRWDEQNVTKNLFDDICIMRMERTLWNLK